MLQGEDELGREMSRISAIGTRLLLRAVCVRTVAMLAALIHCCAVGAREEPSALEIGHEPQFFVDDYIVDNRWGVEYLKEAVTRVFHPPNKDERNPLIAGTGGYVNVVQDKEAGLFRMWYQDYWDQSLDPRKYTYGIAYAESTDGINWKLPRIGKYDFKGTRNNNIVLLGPDNGRAEAQFLLDLPSRHRRGYKYVMLYSTNVRGQSGLHLIGSQDGVDWDLQSDTTIAADFTPDTHTSIVWDPRRRRFVSFTRATNIYRAKGERRKIARLENDALWEPWPITPRNILLPDAVDARTNHHYFYGMPARYYAGVYWGFLWPFRHQEDIYTELAFSRDGQTFRRLPDRPRLIDLGSDGSWDDGMVLASSWLEVGDEWWIYYYGVNGAHKRRQVTPGIGMARIRKGGFVSLRSPSSGGFIVSRLIRWPGGDLYINANINAGSTITARITGYDRQPLKDFDADPSLPLVGDSVRHKVKWKQGDIRSLKGRAIRFEFFMSGVANLFTLRAVSEGVEP